jgi:hypothetical protein
MAFCIGGNLKCKILLDLPAEVNSCGQPSMTISQADIWEYYLKDLEGVKDQVLSGPVTYHYL